MKKRCNLSSAELQEKMGLLKGYYSHYMQAHFDVINNDEANFPSQNSHCDNISKKYEDASLRRLINEKDMKELQQRMLRRTEEPIPQIINNQDQPDSSSEETKKSKAIKSIVVKPQQQAETGELFDHSTQATSQKGNRITVTTVKDDLRHLIYENRQRHRAVTQDLNRAVTVSTNIGRNQERRNANQNRAFASRSKLECFNCGGPHPLSECDDFKFNMTIRSRELRLRELGLCRNCFLPHRPGHVCGWRHRGCQNCGERHNSLLCHLSYHNKN